MHHTHRRARRTALVAAALVCALAAAGPAGAESDRLAKEGGLGFAAMLSSLIYGPVKGVYSLGGLVVSPFAYLLSGGDVDVARRVLDASVRGDYVITPRHLTGDEELEFVGRSPSDRAARERYGDAPPGF